MKNEKLKIKKVIHIFLLLLFSFFFLILSFACGSSPKVSAPDELDIAIREASDYLNTRIPAGDKIAFVNIQSTSNTLSEYIINGLIENTVNDGRYPVIDRQQLDAIRAELNFQYSGEVDDNSMQALGKILGVKTIITGSVTPMGELYRFTVRAMVVETAQIQGQFGRNIPRGRTIMALLSSNGSGSRVTASSANTARATSLLQSTQAAASSASALRNGTYTLFPRPRATQGGRPVNAYVDKIIIGGGYFTVIMVNKPVGKGEGWVDGANSWVAWGSRGNTLQDLDNPRLAYTIVDDIYSDKDSGGVGNIFQNVTGRRFSLTNANETIPTVFNEIILPDQPDR